MSKFKLSDLKNGQFITTDQWNDLYEEIKLTHSIKKTPRIENYKIWIVETTRYENGKVSAYNQDGLSPIISFYTPMQVK